MGYEYYFVNFTKRQYIHIGKRREDIDDTYNLIFDLLHDTWQGDNIGIVSHEHIRHKEITIEFENMGWLYDEEEEQ